MTLATSRAVDWLKAEQRAGRETGAVSKKNMAI